MGIVVPPSPLIVVTDDGASHAVRQLVVPAGSTVNNAVCILAASGGGSTGGGGVDYAVLPELPAYGAELDLAPFVARCQIQPPPPAGATAVVSLNGRDIGGAQVVAGAATVNVPAQEERAYVITWRMLYGSNTYRSAESPITVRPIQPTIEIIDPSEGDDVAVGVLAVAVRVGHPTALPGDFRVQLSFDFDAAAVVNAVYDPLTPDDPGFYIFRGELQVTEPANYWAQARVYDASPGRVPTVASVGVSSLPAYLDFQHTGRYWDPLLELWGATAVEWQFEGGGTSNSLTPNHDYGSVATRITRLVMANFRQLRTIDVGFALADDTGDEFLPTDYNRASQGLNILGNPGRARDLEILCAAHSPFTGTLDLTGFARLRWLELYQSALQSIILAGCTALRRFCAEGVDLSFLDLTDQAACLYDLRCAAMQGLSGSPMRIRVGVMAILYHWCVRSNVNLIVEDANGTPVTGDAFYACFPAMRELWDFGCFRTGVCRPRSPYMQSLQSYYNNYDALDLADQFPRGRGGEVLCAHNPFASVNIDGCPGIIRLDLSFTTLNSASVDYILQTMNAFGTTVPLDPALYYVDLRGNAGPHQAAADAAAAMRLRGWTVWHESVVVTGVTSDNFDRANGPPENGWSGTVGGASGAIVDQELVLSHAGYGVYVTSPAGLPSSYQVQATVPHATTLLGFFGLVLGWVDGNGCRLLFETRATPRVGNAAAYNQSNVAITLTGGFPASWDVDQDHTIAIRRTNSLVQIFTDGQEYGTAICSTNATRTGTSAGFCGEGGGTHVYDSFAITTP